MIKKTTIAYFGSKCNECSRKFDCISATSIASDVRKFFLKILGYRQKETKQMTEGKKYHELKQSGIKTLDEYGIQNFKKDFILGKEIILKEVPVCSPSYGLRGIIDTLTLQYEKNNAINVKIKEIKSSWNKKHYVQMACYGLIFSDINCMLYYTKKGKKKNKLVPIKLYPKFFNLNIEIILELPNDSLSYKFMEDNLILDSTIRNFIFDTINRANFRRKFYKRGIYDLSKTKPCESCQKNSEYCSLWEICSKINYEGEKKTKQYYLGTKKPIIKTKPTIYN